MQHKKDEKRNLFKCTSFFLSSFPFSFFFFFFFFFFFLIMENLVSRLVKPSQQNLGE